MTVQKSLTSWKHCLQVLFYGLGWEEDSNKSEMGSHFPSNTRSWIQGRIIDSIQHCPTTWVYWFQQRQNTTDVIYADLANPLFACTGMKFWLYMTTVIISLPKSIIFVALGAPSSENSKGVKVAKVIAIGIVVLISGESFGFVVLVMLAVPNILTVTPTVYASFWIRKKLKIATKDIEAERAISQGNGELGVSSPYELEMHANGNGLRNASHRGEPITAPAPYHGVDSSKIENHQYWGAGAAVSGKLKFLIKYYTVYDCIWLY